MSSKTEAYQCCPKGSGEKVAAADMVGRYQDPSCCCPCEQQICSICGPCMCVCFFLGPIPFSGTPICPAGTNTWGNFQGYVELRHPLLPPPETPILNPPFPTTTTTTVPSRLLLQSSITPARPPRGPLGPGSRRRPASFVQPPSWLATSASERVLPAQAVQHSHPTRYPITCFDFTVPSRYCIYSAEGEVWSQWMCCAKALTKV